MAVIKWSYPNFSVRVKNSAGTVLLTWRPNTSPLNGPLTMPVRIGPPSPQRESLDRVLLSQERRPWVLGYRVTLPVVWIVTSYYIPGVTGTGLSHLHDVLTYECAGGYVEVTLSGTTWRRVDISRMQQTNLDGRNVGIRLEVDFVRTDLVTTLPIANYTGW